MNTNYSVLMSVYYKEKPEFLKQAMDSMFNQTIPTNDFVLVCDGPLTIELNEIIDTEKTKHKKILNIIRIEKNSGLGNALNIGLKECKNKLVARMDSDDISYSDRCEKQLRIFDKLSGISICSCNINEFNNNLGDATMIRKLPETNEEIVKFSKKKNPFNHMATMIKRDDVLEVGGYQPFYLLEDYYLWIRMLSKGYTAYNIQEVLVSARVGKGMYKRRGGLEYAKSQIELYRYMLNIKWINNYQFIIYSFVRYIVSIMPTNLRKLIFEKMLRIKIK